MIRNPKDFGVWSACPSGVHSGLTKLEMLHVLRVDHKRAEGSMNKMVKFFFEILTGVGMGVVNDLFGCPNCNHFTPLFSAFRT